MLLGLTLFGADSEADSQFISLKYEIQDRVLSHAHSLPLWRR